MDERPIVLVGMMGVGKTAVGRTLAARLGRPFVDADEALVARVGRPISEVFAQDGEDRFRQIEHDVLAELLERRPSPVVATGGGVVLRSDNRRALGERARVVWLRAPVAELARRVGSGTGRPLLGGDPLAALTALDAARSPLYAEVADVRVETTGRGARELAEELAGALSTPPSSEPSADRAGVTS